VFRITPLFATTILLFAVNSASGEESASNSPNANNSTGEDLRQLVSMPEQTRQFMREDMLNHLSALNEIISLLASNNLGAAADVAETKMGRSTMGKHRGTGMGPGRYMPLEMRNIGWGMHDAATEFSQVAKKGGLADAYNALQKITASCVACHYSYRTR